MMPPPLIFRRHTVFIVDFSPTQTPPCRCRYRFQRCWLPREAVAAADSAATG